MGIENRKSPRYPYRSRLEVTPTKKASESDIARAVNLSAGGICFEHPLVLKAAEKIQVRFPLPEPLEVMAEVRHATRVSTEIGGMELDPIWLVGAAFLNLDYVQQRRIEGIVASLAAAFSGRDVSDDDDL